MEITFAQKTPSPKIVPIKDLPVGAVFIRFSEADKPKDEVDYYLVTMRNGHKEYINLNDSAYCSLAYDRLSVIQMDCALTIYGPKGE